MKLFLCSSYLLCLALVLCSTNGFAQEASAEKKKTKLKPDSNFVMMYPQYITLGIFTSAPLMQITITPVNGSLEKYKSDFRGNFSDLLGLSFSYRSVSLFFGFKTPFGKGNDPAKGRTVSTGLALRVRKPNITVTAEYRRYNGYYDDNAPNYTEIPEGVYYVRPDMRYKNIGVNGVYNFSWRKFSYNAPITFHERQLKTRLGILTKAGINYTTIYSSDTTLLSRAQTDEFTSFEGINSIHALLLKAGPGLGLNLVFFKRFYFSFNYFIMANFIEYNYNKIGEESKKWHPNANLYTESYLAFGYNSKRLFAGMTFTGDINIMRIQGARVNTNFASAVITVGYRFNSPKLFAKGWNKTIGKLKKSE